jgi:hypothetical protein
MAPSPRLCRLCGLLAIRTGHSTSLPGSVALSLSARSCSTSPEKGRTAGDTLDSGQSGIWSIRKALWILAYSQILTQGRITGWVAPFSWEHEAK